MEHLAAQLAEAKEAHTQQLKPALALWELGPKLVALAVAHAVAHAFP